MEITQKSKQKFWKDESGQLIPYNRTTKVERLHERLSGQLLKEAQRLNRLLTAFKRRVNDACLDAYHAYMKEKEVRGVKGNFTWYNFNRTIKIEVNIHERITFDELGVIAAKEKFNEFLNANIESKDQFIKQMVLDAFETSKGKLDAKKIMGLIRYKSKIKNETFQRAVELLEESIRRPDSRTYFRISIKDENGKYQFINLNFSSVELKSKQNENN